MALRPLRPFAVYHSVLTSMAEMEDVNEVTTEAEAAPVEGPPHVSAPPITSRFLFVDVAAMRAKQLRRGARPRLGPNESLPHKAERIAMREVTQGLVDYEVPAPKAPAGAQG